MKERSKKSRSILFSFLFKKDQKGYGFIVKPEDIDSLKSRQNLQILDEYKTGIYFKEKEIGPRLLSLLKKRYKRLSKKCFEHNIDIKYLAFGIYVEFEIDTFGKQAKNVELYNFKGLILSSFTSQTAFVCIQESFIENPILLKKVFFEDEVASLSLGVKKGGFYDILKKQSLDESKRKEVSIELLLNDKIRQKIQHRHIYTSLVNDYLNELNDNIKQQIKIEIRTALKSKDTPQETKDLYWKNITFLQKELEKESHLWDYATREIKAQVIREKYDAFFGCLEKFFKSSYRYKEYLNGSVATFYCLNEDELKLVNQWSGNNHSDSFMKMVSARAAEKVVQEYYRKTGYLSVKDISLTQVFSGNNEDWKLFDIEAIREDKVIYIDVKNARNSIYSKIYSKFCIRKHKRNKLGEAITIAGTLSPLDVLKSEVDQLCPNYTSQDQKEVTQDLKIKLQNHKVTFLGCFDKRLFEEIQKQFNNDQFIAIYLENKRGESIHYPHWLFDYDDDFYYKQNQIITESAGLLNDDIPTFEDFELVNLNISPLPLLIASGKWRQNLDYFDQWQLDFIKILWGDLKEYKDVKLPYIYLAILKHFLIVVTCNEQPKNYNPKDYEKLLYCTSNDSFPLKRYDPVCLEENMPTIRALCHTLNILFFDRSKINFNQFTRYQFRGTGLLTGITYQGERKTILAYCGGRIKKNRRITHSCGCSPLILGVNNLCEAILEPENTICNHLICERCGFCQQNCPGYINRKIIKFSRYKLLNKPQPNISYNDKSDKTKLYELSLNVAKTKNAKLHKEIKKLSTEKIDYLTAKIWLDSQEKIDEVEAFQEGNDIDMEGELVVESWYSGEKQEKIFLYVENIELSF